MRGHWEGTVVMAAWPAAVGQTRAVWTDRGMGSGCPFRPLAKASLLESGSLELHFLPEPRRLGLAVYFSHRNIDCTGFLGRDAL